MASKLTAAAVRRFVPPRRAGSRKGDNGRVLVLGGSLVYHGAPILSSMAALRSGTDLVYTAVPGANVQATRAFSPNLIVLPLADQKITAGAVRKLAGRIPGGIDSAAIGMGLAVQDRAALVRLAAELADADVRLLLDASALVPEMLDAVRGKNCVLSPHAGEYRRMFGEDPPAAPAARARAVERQAKKCGAAILLKGPTDVISDGKTTFMHRTATPSMTVGGTGDVLSGLVAGILARNRRPVQAAAAGALIAGLAGAHAQRRLGLHLAATDLVDALPLVMKRFDRVKA